VPGVHSQPLFFFISAKCIDEYVKQRNRLVESKDPTQVKINPDLERIVLGIFDRCFADKRYKQALGIALDARLLDKIEQTIAGSDDVPEMLSYCTKICTDVILNRDFRQNVRTPLSPFFLLLLFLSEEFSFLIHPFFFFFFFNSGASTFGETVPASQRSRLSAHL
jgi:hypothetical protein